MPISPDALERMLFAAETAFLLTGIYGVWAFQFRHSSAPLRVARVAHWSIPPSGLFSFLAVGLVGAFLGALMMRLAVGLLSATYSDDADFRLIAENAGLHLGVLLALISSRRLAELTLDEHPAAPATPAAPPLARRHNVPAGFITFCICVALLVPVGLGWRALLEALGIDVVQQDLVQIFGEIKDEPKLLLMTLTAVVIAPITEEIVFRAGLFRFLRTRVPRWAAFSITAVCFAALHMNLAAFAPLLLLSVIFCLAYERTGRISVSMIAHGLFNLNTVVLILGGIDV